MRLDLAAVYRDLHANPELSFQEHRTAGIVAEALGRFGFAVTTGIGRTGVVGVLENGEGPTVLLRADMDGLPVLEATGLPYASTARGTDHDGHDVPVMHACGHDVHVTCLLGASERLAADRDSWAGTLACSAGCRRPMSCSASTWLPFPPGSRRCTRGSRWRLPTRSPCACTAS